MSAVLTSERRMSKKPYQCCYCALPIPQGTLHEYRTGVSYGDFWTMRAHPECDALACEHWDEADFEGMDADPQHREQALKEFDSLGQPLAAAKP